MEIKIIEMKERKCKLVLKNSSPAKANALRRTILFDIPKMAIDNVEFWLGHADWGNETNTPLFNEIIAHRLGMIPIPTDESFEMDDSNSDGDYRSSAIKYVIKENGPKTVYSGDLKLVDGPIDFEDKSLLEIKDKKIPIVELGKGQSILAYAYAVMGTAKKHVKWQVASGVGYKYMPIIDINDEVIDSAEDIVKSCPKKVFDFRDGRLTIRDALVCSLCKTCEELSGGSITVTGDSSQFLFTFETDGSLTAEQVINKAMSILSKNAKKIADDVIAL
ncbi:MAG: DNA-directed RNA polymerase subunit D [archaeon]|nr:DNA-directed RNA polymerase subunit D [archaeon]